MDLSVHTFQVHFKMKLTYETLATDDDDVIQQADDEASESGGKPVTDNHTRSQWDDDCPWSEWHSAEDPIKGIYVLLYCISLWTIGFCGHLLYMESGVHTSWAENM